jgi:glycosyltransferase involved in cell wall biosynthesis
VTQRFTILLAINRPPVFLPCAVESVLAQTVKEFELFVICDGAPVETIDCARQHARRDPRIKVLVLPKGERIGEAHLHNALMAASGRYVAHIEDDDLWFPTHLEELEKLLQIADFGHVMHVWAKPDESIEMLPSDLTIPELRQRMLGEKFNRFGFSVCGYRLDAYRRLSDGWAPGQKGLWPDLNMWRKFLRCDDLKFGTRIAVTALVLASGFRTHMSLDERAQECRKWLNRIVDECERAKIVESAWRSIVNKGLQLEFELSREVQARTEIQAKLESELSREVQARTEIQAKLESELSREVQARVKIQAELERVLNSISWRITKPLRAFRGTLAAATGGLATRTTMLVYVIATVGFAMLIFGGWGFFVLNNAGPMVEVALTDYAIAFEMIGGGLGLIGLAQSLRLLLEINIRR